MENMTERQVNGTGQNRKKHRMDLLLLAVLLLIGLVMAAVLFLNRHDGKIVQVRVDGEVTAEFFLEEGRTYEIEGADGGTNLLMIQGGSAWIEEADCPDALCCKMGKIHLTGQSVVCLPHQVVVEIVDAEPPEDGLDAVAG